MYRAKLKQQKQELEDILERELPITGINPDDFIETYDESGEFMDVQKAFKVNAKGLSAEEELRLLNEYASEMDDPRFIEGSFRLLKNGWVAIPEEEVESVLWRQGETVFCFEYDRDAEFVGESVPYSWV